MALGHSARRIQRRLRRLRAARRRRSRAAWRRETAGGGCTGIGEGATAATDTQGAVAVATLPITAVRRVGVAAVVTARLRAPALVVRPGRAMAHVGRAVARTRSLPTARAVPAVQRAARAIVVHEVTRSRARGLWPRDGDGGSHGEAEYRCRGPTKQFPPPDLAGDALRGVTDQVHSLPSLPLCDGAFPSAMLAAIDSSPATRRSSRRREGSLQSPFAWTRLSWPTTNANGVTRTR